MAAVTTGTVLENEAIDAARALSSCAALLARAAGRSLAPWHMSWPQGMSLLLLRAQDEPTTASHLVEQLGLGRTAMTAVVDRLERRGWVCRVPHHRDRRVSLLQLTDDGRRVADEITAALGSAFGGVLSRSELPPGFDALTVELIRRFGGQDYRPALVNRR